MKVPRIRCFASLCARSRPIAQRVANSPIVKTSRWGLGRGILVTSMCDDSASRSNWKTGFVNDGVDRNGNGKCVQLCHGSVSCR